MKFQVIIRPEAEIDLQDAFQWYEEQEEGLGSEFLRFIDASISLISRTPKMFPLIYKSIRRVLTHRFPYGIFFTLEEKKIVVLAILHVRRHPIHWQKRK